MRSQVLTPYSPPILSSITKHKLGLIDNGSILSPPTDGITASFPHPRVSYSTYNRKNISADALQGGQITGTSIASWAEDALLANIFSPERALTQKVFDGDETEGVENGLGIPKRFPIAMGIDILGERGADEANSGIDKDKDQQINEDERNTGKEKAKGALEVTEIFNMFSDVSAERERKLRSSVSGSKMDGLFLNFQGQSFQSSGKEVIIQSVSHLIQLLLSAETSAQQQQTCSNSFIELKTGTGESSAIAIRDKQIADLHITHLNLSRVKCPAVVLGLLFAVKYSFDAPFTDIVAEQPRLSSLSGGSSDIPSNSSCKLSQMALDLERAVVTRLRHSLLSLDLSHAIVESEGDAHAGGDSGADLSSVLSINPAVLLFREALQPFGEQGVSSFPHLQALSVDDNPSLFDSREEKTRVDALLALEGFLALTPTNTATIPSTFCFVQTLRLANTGLGTLCGLRALASGLKANTTLKSLVLAQNNFGQAAKKDPSVYTDFCEALGNHHGLEMLDLSDCELSTENVVELFNYLGRGSGNLSGFLAGWSSMDEGASASFASSDSGQQDKQMKKEDLWSTIQILNLSGNNCGNEGTRMIASVLCPSLFSAVSSPSASSNTGRLPSLQHLNLSKCQVGSSGLAYLCKALDYSAVPIRVLNLAGNCFSAEDGERSRSNRKSFTIDFVPSPVSAVSYNRNNMNGKNGDESTEDNASLTLTFGMAALIDVIRHTRELTVLDLSYNELTPRHIVDLAGAFHANKSLVCLNLSGNPIGASSERIVCDYSWLHDKADEVIGESINSALATVTVTSIEQSTGLPAATVPISGDQSDIGFEPEGEEICETDVDHRDSVFIDSQRAPNVEQVTKRVVIDKKASAMTILLAAFCDETERGRCQLSTLVLNNCQLGSGTGIVAKEERGKQKKDPEPPCYTSVSTVWDSHLVSLLSYLCHHCLERLCLTGNDLTNTDLQLFANKLYEVGADKKVYEGTSLSMSMSGSIAGGIINGGWTTTRNKADSPLSPFGRLGSPEGISRVNLGGGRIQRRRSITDMTEEEKQLNMEALNLGEGPMERSLVRANISRLLGNNPYNSDNSENDTSRNNDDEDTRGVTLREGSMGSLYGIMGTGGGSSASSFCTHLTARLRYLSLGNNPLLSGEGAGRAIARIVQICDKLFVFILDDCPHIGDEGLQVACEKMKNHSSLSVLSLANIGLKYLDSLAYSVPLMKRLIAIDLSRNDELDAQSIDEFTNVILKGVVDRLHELRKIQANEELSPALALRGSRFSGVSPFLSGGQLIFPATDGKENKCDDNTNNYEEEAKKSYNNDEVTEPLATSDDEEPEIRRDMISTHKDAHQLAVRWANNNDRNERAEGYDTEEDDDDEDGCHPPPVGPDAEDVPPSVSLMRQASRVAMAAGGVGMPIISPLITARNCNISLMGMHGDTIGFGGGFISPVMISNKPEDTLGLTAYMNTYGLVDRLAKEESMMINSALPGRSLERWNVIRFLSLQVALKAGKTTDGAAACVPAISFQKSTEERRIVAALTKLCRYGILEDCRCDFNYMLKEQMAVETNEKKSAIPHSDSKLDLTEGGGTPTGHNISNVCSGNEGLLPLYISSEIWKCDLVRNILGEALAPIIESQRHILAEQNRGILLTCAGNLAPTLTKAYDALQTYVAAQIMARPSSSVARNEEAKRKNKVQGQKADVGISPAVFLLLFIRLGGIGGELYDDVERNSQLRMQWMCLRNRLAMGGERL